MKTELTTAEVATRLSVSRATVKRWADEGLLPCIKTVGRHRRFLAADVDRFRQAQHAEGLATTAHDAADPLIEILLHGDSSYALEANLLTRRARLGSWWRVAETLGLTLEAIGVLWRRGELSIVEEHVASERLGRALARACEWLPTAPQAPRALLATAVGDEHTLGLSLVELCLRELGWVSWWAGRRTPLKALATAVAHPRQAVQLVAVSASTVSTDAADLAAQEAEIGRACRRTGVPLLLGGGGAWPVAPTYGVRLDSLATLVTFVRELDAARAQRRG